MKAIYIIMTVIFVIVCAILEYVLREFIQDKTIKRWIKTILAELIVASIAALMVVSAVSCFRRGENGSGWSILALVTGWEILMNIGIVSGHKREWR